MSYRLCAVEPVSSTVCANAYARLFSNTLALVIVQTSVKVLDILEASIERRNRLMNNAPRIRTQMSAAHSREELDRAIDAFIETRRHMEIIG